MEAKRPTSDPTLWRRLSGSYWAQRPECATFSIHSKSTVVLGTLARLLLVPFNTAFSWEVHIYIIA